MRLGPKIISLISLTLAAAGCWLAATIAVGVIEDRSGHAVAVALIEGGHDWSDVHTDGLQVHIGGIAPTEAKRFNALHLAGKVVDATRLVDGTTVQPSAPLTPPRFSIEILRNDEGVTLIGLVPQSLDRMKLVSEITRVSPGVEVTDLLEGAHYPVPEGWEAAVDHGMRVLGRLPRSKISIAAGTVSVTAISGSEEEKAQIEQELQQRVPAGVTLSHNITAPRPVITPFTLRFLIDRNGPRFDACAADTQRARDRILAAANGAGLDGTPDCTLGLGVPTAEWADGVVQGIDALARLGNGSITFADADVTLIAAETTPQADFDRVVGELESNLPEVFSLHSILRQPETLDDEGAENRPPEFVATRSPEGQVQLRGRLNNELVRDTVESFSKARFGVESVYTATRIDAELPDGWPVRVLAGLQALAELESGSAVVQEDFIELRGTSGNRHAQAEVARILGQKLGEGQQYAIDVAYDEKLDPIAAMPTPDECVTQVNDLLAGTKINFEPGSAEISGSAMGVLDDIAEILKACREVEMQIEIAGHTDSQGREEMNLELSHGRAQAVLDALMARRVLTSKIRAHGYGETEPIADNDTEEGREANRRIEFRLVENNEAAETETEGEDATDAEPVDTDDPGGTPDETQSGELDATTGAADPPEAESATDTPEADGPEDTQ